MGRMRWVESAATGARAVSGTWADRGTGGWADRSSRADRRTAGPPDRKSVMTRIYRPPVRPSGLPPVSSAQRNVPAGDQQFGIENRRSRRSPDRVVAHGHEPVSEHRVPRDAAHGDAHAAARVAREDRKSTRLHSR